VGVLRGVPLIDQPVLIGEPDTAPDQRAFRRPPPPPPPAEPIVEPEPPPSAVAPWSSEAAEPEPVGPHPLEEVVQEKLAEAERLLLEAQEQADQLLAAARREAAELTDEAKATLESARQQAEALRAAAEADVDRIKDEAEAAGHVVGYDAGHAEGLAKADELTAEKIAHVTRLAISAAVDRRELLHNAEAEVVRLATRIARKVVQRELMTDPTIVHRLAEAALRHVAADGLVRLRVNPDDYAELGTYWARAHGSVENDRTYELVADPAIGRGGVVIETRAGTIDAQLETQLDEIALALGVEGERGAHPGPLPEGEKDVGAPLTEGEEMVAG
jgi:flagellar assembly protein FliH